MRLKGLETNSLEQSETTMTKPKETSTSKLRCGLKNRDKLTNIDMVLESVPIIQRRIAEQWTKGKIKPFRAIDWVGLEQTLRAIRKSKLEPQHQLLAVDEALAAYTRRG